ncbi:helicase domain protein [Thermosinus carboxydivorans Nor1]|uniref:Helicase domain protein n=1 Tax=Thermosinus carboxydivorans Nor1 TaxID=401526 RepID=A1HMN5_9FIRM|nr:helicase-related protein [Thermosinus carboxydivorans]EAX48524.1 helicase domain protein [Thermosinus carboxydivorans Nor1]
MARLEELTRGAKVKGLLPDGLATVVDVKWYGTAVVELTYKDPAGRPHSELIYRDRESSLEIAENGLPWSFDGDGGLLKLVSEAYRIRLAYLFDPQMAVHTSLVEPLPHQITAVYGELLTRQPLRFLLADDPGAGKTIMTGLFIKELMVRGDLSRCLIVSPGNLADQWQDEMYSRFQLPFEILTNDRIEASRTGNIFNEIPMCIARLDKLARDENLQVKLGETEWDLIVVDEAHKMSASFFGGEVKFTKRYRLGQLLGRIARHFLLLTATPHNGKEEDFQLFMALLDADRFEGRFRDGVHTVDVSDLMRRMVKEELLKFDGTPLFPERMAYTVNYTLSDAEADLYSEVTGYVRDEFNRAEALASDSRKGTVGFALTILQRRLASSPEAIYQSLRRRRERLEKRLREEKILRRGHQLRQERERLISLSAEDLADLEDAPGAEVEEIEEMVVDQATAAQTIAELEAEIDKLRYLEKRAKELRASGADRKWDELSKLLQNETAMFDAGGMRRKLVIFTEHRDTLNYLAEKIRSLLGRDDAVATIQGGMGREERKRVQELFTHDKHVHILIATDAAGEGINLQRANLMINYDLPWNPNRLEQRFGRIHRIGQTEVCHLWNMVAVDTREGEVYFRLLKKLEEEREALGGKVFDVLGKITFDNRPLRDLLIEAIRYGDRPEVKMRLYQAVDQALDRDALVNLLEERALSHDVMDVHKVMKIREEMERLEARRLQPHFIAAFFKEAFKLFGGVLREREPGRYEITHVPAVIRARDRQIGTREPVMTRYERVCFEKDLIYVQGKPQAAFICPGHPLLDATIDLILERNRDLLKRGAILIDPNDGSDTVRALVYLEHAVQDGRTTKDGSRRIVSRQVQFVEISVDGSARAAGYAPYLDYRPAEGSEKELILQYINKNWLQADLEAQAMTYAITTMVPGHFAAVKRRKEELIAKTMAAVKDRLTKEINYWDLRAEELKLAEQAGKVNAKINSAKARQRADELEARLKRRLDELNEERNLSPLPPMVIGGALVVPQGLIDRLTGSRPPLFAHDTQGSERKAMDAVMAYERSLGYEPRDVSSERCGYDIESRIPGTGKLRFIEVKGRAPGATTVTVTKNEILTALNKPDDYFLAIVEVGESVGQPQYIKCPFRSEPDFAATSVNYSIADLFKGQSS